MGVSVKTLLIHLRERQEQFGVCAFHFHHVLRNTVLEPAHYPDTAQSVLDSEDQVDFKIAKTSKINEVPKASTTPEGPIPMSPIGDHTQNPSPVVDNVSVPAQHFMPVAPPGWSQFPAPAYWGPQFMPAANPNPLPHYPQYSIMYDQQLMPQYEGQPGRTAAPVPAAEHPLQLPEQLMNGFQGPSRAVAMGRPVPPFHPLPVPLPFHPPCQSVDPHPIPSGDPPFTYLHPSPSIPFVQRPMDHSVKTPTKKLPANTTTKTSAKRKKKEVEDTPSKKPTRASNRTRTPKKMFEVVQ